MQLYQEENIQCCYRRYNSVAVYLGLKSAYKVIKSEDGARVDGIRELAFLTSGLRHPNIIELEDRALFPNFMVLQFPKALGDLVKVRIPEDHKNRVTLELISAVRFLHSNGVMHRDIKPGNVLIFEGYSAKLSDFGCCRMMPAPWAQGYTEEVYTPCYRAPEIFMGKKYDFTADIWSLGCTIMQLYTGNILFDADKDGDILDQIYSFRSSKGKCKDYLSQVKKIFPQIVQLLDQMLQINPNLRVQFCQRVKKDYPPLVRKVDVSQIIDWFGNRGIDPRPETIWKTMIIYSQLTDSEPHLAISALLASKIHEVTFCNDCYNDYKTTLLETEVLGKISDLFYPAPVELINGNLTHQFLDLCKSDLPYKLTTLQIVQVLEKGQILL